MTARARWTAADLDRLLKAAKAHGFAVELEGEKVRLLPTDGAAPLTSSGQAEKDWDAALGLSWRPSA